MSSLSVCLVPNVHCKRSQLRTICTCVTNYTHNFVLFTSQMQRTSRSNGFSVSEPLEKSFYTITQTIKRYYRLQQLELCFVLQMDWCITHHMRGQYIETTLQCPEMKLKCVQFAQMQSRTSTRGSLRLHQSF